MEDSKSSCRKKLDSLFCSTCFGPCYKLWCNSWWLRTSEAGRPELDPNYDTELRDLGKLGNPWASVSSSIKQVGGLL